MPRAKVPDTDEAVWLPFGPQAVHELSAHRFALALRPSDHNDKTGLMVCCTVSTQIKRPPFEVLAEYDGVRCPVLSDRMKSLAWRVRRARKKAVLSADVLVHVRAKMKALVQIA